MIYNRYKRFVNEKIDLNHQPFLKVIFLKNMKDNPDDFLMKDNARKVKRISVQTHMRDHIEKTFETQQFELLDHQRCKAAQRQNKLDNIKRINGRDKRIRVLTDWRTVEAIKKTEIIKDVISVENFTEVVAEGSVTINRLQVIGEMFDASTQTEDLGPIIEKDDNDVIQMILPERIESKVNNNDAPIMSLEVSKISQVDIISRDISTEIYLDGDKRGVGSIGRRYEDINLYFNYMKAERTSLFSNNNKKGYLLNKLLFEDTMEFDNHEKFAEMMRKKNSFHFNYANKESVSE